MLRIDSQIHQHLPQLICITSDARKFWLEIELHLHTLDLKLVRDQPMADLAVEVRRAFSAIVTGNVKEPGIRMIKKNGPFQLRADSELTDALDRLLRSFADQGRMRLVGEYTPCYDVIEASA